MIQLCSSSFTYGMFKMNNNEKKITARNKFSFFFD